MASTIPLRIDSELVNQARNAGSLHDRPPTAQIEHWAKLGRVLDSVLSGRSIAQVKQLARVEDLDTLVALTQSAAGQAKARALITRHKGPIYTADPEQPDVILEKLPDGTIRPGRFIRRRFVPAVTQTRTVARKRATKSARTKAHSSSR
ncbi:MAG TPA: hypothetical protein VGA56_14090 [Opitutaceae bacterium]